MSSRPLAVLLLAATACAAPPGKPPPGAPVTRGAPPPEAIAETPEARDLLGAPPAVVMPIVTPGPSPTVFVGGPLAELEALTGPPALTRAEGEGEFRRYDLTEGCRAYAVVTNGTVQALETGPSVQGGVSPRFEDCTAR